MGGARPHLGAQTPGERRPLRLFVCAEGGGGGGGGEGRARCAGPGGRRGQKPLCGGAGRGSLPPPPADLGGGFPLSLVSAPAEALPGCRRGRAGRRVPCALGGGLRASGGGPPPGGSSPPLLPFADAPGLPPRPPLSPLSGEKLCLRLGGLWGRCFLWGAVGAGVNGRGRVRVGGRGEVQRRSRGWQLFVTYPEK